MTATTHCPCQENAAHINTACHAMLNQMLSQGVRQAKPHRLIVSLAS